MSRPGETLQAKLLEMMRRESRAVSAYDLLGELREENPKIAPTTVYRALSSLVDRGAVHRLESLNAFVACQCDAHSDATILSICDDCGDVAENVEPDVFTNLTTKLKAKGFTPQRHVIEVHGVCASCESEQAQP